MTYRRRQSNESEFESGQKHIYARKHQLYCYIISKSKLAFPLSNKIYLNVIASTALIKVIKTQTH